MFFFLVSVQSLKQAARVTASPARGNSEQAALHTTVAACDQRRGGQHPCIKMGRSAPLELLRGGQHLSNPVASMKRDKIGQRDQMPRTPSVGPPDSSCRTLTSRR